MTETLNKIGENKLIAFITSLATLIVLAIFASTEIFAGGSAIIVSLFGMLNTKSKGEKDV